jgi:hypothetical protein
MTKKNMIITTTMLITASMPALPATILLPSSITVAELAKETSAKKTLKQVLLSATRAADEAFLLRSIGGPTTPSPDLHRIELGALKDEVNRMGQEIRTLRSEEDSLAPWEQQAVEEILPLFQAEAANTDRAIGSFNENQELLWTEANRKYADRVSQDSEQIAQIAENCLKYEKLREQEIQLEKRISANSGE